MMVMMMMANVVDDFDTIQFLFFDIAFFYSNRYEHIMKAAKERKQDQIETGQSKAGGVLV